MLGGVDKRVEIDHESQDWNLTEQDWNLNDERDERIMQHLANNGGDVGKFAQLVHLASKLPAKAKEAKSNFINNNVPNVSVDVPVPSIEFRTASEIKA